MRAESSRQWREFLSGYDRIHVYTVDPGAHAIASELVLLVRGLGRLSGWFVEGWAAAHTKEGRPVADLLGVLRSGDTLILGSQTNFARTHDLLQRAIAVGAATIFVFDHWKNYAAHFCGGLRPDVIVVPDLIASNQLVAAMGEQGQSHMRILPHLGIEAAAERVISYGEVTQPNMVAVLLDPTELTDGLGYDWRRSLAAAIDMASIRPGVSVMVKPHPRQDAEIVKRELLRLEKHQCNPTLYSGETERLIAMASEVWGMTTVALNIALAVGKPIRSIQIGRNEAGTRASNPHIEPFAIVQ